MIPRSLRRADMAAFAMFPTVLWLILSPPGFAFARGPGTDTPDSPQVENVPQERLERWQAMSPEERERIRERYRRWKELPPGERDRILERNRRWRKLPEEQRSYLKDRREMLRDAGPEERSVVRKFFARMRSLPPEARRAARREIWEWRSLPPGEREERMLSWPFYQGLSDRERDALRWFLFARPAERHGNADQGPRE